jgi:hypothetical protein
VVVRARLLARALPLACRRLSRACPACLLYKYPPCPIPPPPQHSSRLRRYLTSSAHHSHKPQLADPLPLIPHYLSTNNQVSIDALIHQTTTLPPSTACLFLRKHIADDDAPIRSPSPHLTIIMFYSTVVLAAAAFSGLVAAQGNSTVKVDPNSLTPALRQSFCRAQLQTCPQLCEDQRTTPGGNTCDTVSRYSLTVS